MLKQPGPGKWKVRSYSRRKEQTSLKESERNSSRKPSWGSRHAAGKILGRSTRGSQRRRYAPEARGSQSTMVHREAQETPLMFIARWDNVCSASAWAPASSVPALQLLLSFVHAPLKQIVTGIIVPCLLHSHRPSASRKEEPGFPEPDRLHFASQAKHTEHHEGRHYSIPLEEVKAVFPHGLPYRFQQQVPTEERVCREGAGVREEPDRACSYAAFLLE